jgi:hypothetical protein
MIPTRKTAVVAGVFFIAAAVFAIVGLALYHDVLNDPAYVVRSSAADTMVMLGALNEIIVVASVIGTAVTLFPVVRRQSEGIALGYVAGRTVEGVVIAVGIMSLLTVVSLRQGHSAGDAASFVTTGKALVALHNWTFLFGPNIALGPNTTMLAYLMYRSRLVPRVIPVIGLVGGPLIFLSGLGVLFGLYTQTSAWGAVTAIPVFVWEMSLALWMIIRGFNPSPILATGTRLAPQT